MNAIQRLVEKQMLEEDEANARFKKRMFMLIPYNAMMVFFTLKYMKNYTKIANRLWPNVQKATLRNLLYVGTIQALGMTTLYLGGNLAILGVNPRAIYLRHKKQEEDMANIANQPIFFEEEMKDQVVDLLKDADILPQGEPNKKVQDVFLMQMFKSMGLSDKTIMVIEQDLRSQHIKELQKRA